MTLTVSYCIFHGFAHADKSQAVMANARNIFLKECCILLLQLRRTGSDLSQEKSEANNNDSNNDNESDKGNNNDGDLTTTTTATITTTATTTITMATSTTTTTTITWLCHITYVHYSSSRKSFVQQRLEVLLCWKKTMPDQLPEYSL